MDGEGESFLERGRILNLESIFSEIILTLLFNIVKKTHSV